jgi:tetratricopeptide (TPR) repeat protein
LAAGQKVGFTPQLQWINSIKPPPKGFAIAQKSKDFMKHVPYFVYRPLRLLTLAATLMFSLAHADEYADVSQLVRNGKLTEALNKADQYLSNKPRDPQLRFLKGVIQRDAGKATDAISTFTRLTEDYPELPEPYNNLAVLYAGQSQFDKARTALEMAIRTNPSYATAHENLGDVYSKLASQAYNKALQLDASNPAVAPKLALIRELFSQSGGVDPRASTTSGPASSNNSRLPSNAGPASTAGVFTASSKPIPTLPGPVSNKTPPAPPAAVSPTSSEAAAILPAPTASPVTPPVTAVNNASKDAESAVYAWAKAWAARDLKGYFAAYGKDFAPPGSMTRSAWEDERRLRISSKSKISLKLENLTVTVDGNKAIVKFRQDYKASGLSFSSRKTLELVKNGERWHIVNEITGT